MKVGQLVRVRVPMPPDIRDIRWFYGLILEAKCWNDFITVYCAGSVLIAKRTNIQILSGRGRRKNVKRSGV